MYGRSAGSGRGQNGSNYSARSAAAGGGGGSSSMNMAVAGGGSGRMAPVKNYQTVPSDSRIVSSSGGAMLEGEWSSLNPSLYQNMSNEQVDWAALAQQWIQMKETLPADMVPAAPPPPIISESYGSNSRDSQPDDGRLGGSVGEQGEAPMEVERDEDHSSAMGHHQQTSQAWDNGAVSWQYPSHSEWRNPAWDSNWSSGSSNSNKAYDSNSMTVTVNPNATLAVANWQAKIARIYKLSESNNSSAIAGTVQPTVQANHHHQQQDLQSKRIPGLMDQVIKLDHNSVDAGGDQEDDTTQTINDAKRKLLPAWIREGLEKMEREKQRQAEKEKEQQQRAELLHQRRQAELEALSELEAAKRKSKFESDSEEDEAEHEDKQDDVSRGEESPVPSRSREEVLQELMIAVRKNLTEILLEVTNEEIALVAKETLAKTRRKAPTAQALRKTGLATLTGGLGLGIYGDSDEEDESGSDNDRDDDGNSEDDEEAERALRNTIKQRQKEFEWTAREIEDQIAKEEAIEERKRREYDQSQKDQHQHNASDEEDYGTGSGRAGLGHSQQMAAVPGTSGGKFGPRDGETQPVNDKLYAYKLGRSRDKRVSRFSDPKDTVRQTHITHVAIVNHKAGEVVPPLAIPKVNQAIPAVPSAGNVVSPPVSAGSASSVPLFPAAVAAVRHMEDIRRGSSVASETPSNASSSRASSSHRSGREAESRKSSHKSSRKAKKHKRSRDSHSDDEDDDDEDDRYSQHSRRSRSSERSGYSRRRRSYSRDSRDDDRDRKYSYKSRDRSRSRSRDRYKSSKRRTRSRSRSSSRRRY